MTSPRTSSDIGGGNFTVSFDDSVMEKRPDEQVHVQAQNIEEIRLSESLSCVEPQEEALGYDNTMLLSRSSLSEVAKGVFKKHRKAKILAKKPPNDDSSSKESENVAFMPYPDNDSCKSSDADSDFSVSQLEFMD